MLITVAVIGIVGTAMTSDIAWGQVTCDAGAYQAGVGGAVRLNASTYAPGACPAPQIKTITNAYIQGWDSTVVCEAGSTYAGGGVCHDEEFGESQAFVHVNGSFLCGPWQGRSEHYVMDSSETWFSHIFPPYALNGPQCVVTEPEECGEDEYWDGERCIPINCPILVPTTRSQQIKMTSVDDGVLFDIDGDGDLDQVSWTDPTSRVGWLALDRNGDGMITSGKELIGNHTEEQKPHGFEVLIQLAPGKAVLDSDDDLFNRLMLWEDRNHNGVSEPSELQPASNIISQLGLGYVPHNRKDGHGNKFALQGWAAVRTGPGKNSPESRAEEVERNIKIYDVFLVKR